MTKGQGLAPTMAATARATIWRRLMTKSSLWVLTVGAESASKEALMFALSRT